MVIEAKWEIVSWYKNGSTILNDKGVFYAQLLSIGLLLSSGLGRSENDRDSLTVKQTDCLQGLVVGIAESVEKGAVQICEYYFSHC